MAQTFKLAARIRAMGKSTSKPADQSAALALLRVESGHVTRPRA